MAGLGWNNKRLEYKQEPDEPKEPDQEPNRDIATPHVWVGFGFDQVPLVATR